MTLRVAICVLGLWCASAYALTVFDPTAHAQRSANQAAQLAEMAKQWVQLFDQYKRMGEQLEAITKTRDLKALLGLKDIQSLIDPLALATLKTLEASGINDVTAINNRKIHAHTVQTAQAIEARKAEIDRLVSAASATTDAKAAADLTARAAGQTAVLLNELLYQMELQKAAVSKNILDEQRLREQRHAELTSGTANPFKLKLP
jgi:hypothetical protein